VVFPLSSSTSCSLSFCIFVQHRVLLKSLEAFLYRVFISSVHRSILQGTSEIQDVRKRLYLFKKLCCLLGAILKILCPRERRVFQSKLWVSSSNQCNLRHSPYTGHLEKKSVQSFSDTCIFQSWILRGQPTPDVGFPLSSSTGCSLSFSTFVQHRVLLNSLEVFLYRVIIISEHRSILQGTCEVYFGHEFYGASPHLMWSFSCRVVQAVR
jgi:hypothetical protein